MKKLLCAFVAVLLVFGNFILPVSAEKAGHNHKYYIDYISRSADGRTVKSFGLFCEDCDEVKHIKTGATVIDYSISNNGWGTEGQTTWYFIDGLVSLKDPVRIYGTVNLVLLDNALFICESGIHVYDNSTLNIYSEHLDYSPAGDKNTMGVLRSYARDESGEAAAIGSVQKGKNVTVNIYGGDIYAFSDGSGAAIGSGYNYIGENSSVAVNIYGGKVRANATGDAAAIGGGYNYTDAKLNFYGGIVHASNTGKYAASIGCGFWECHAQVNFFGGYVYGEAKTTDGSHIAGIVADPIKRADGAKQFGNIDGIYDDDGMALAKQAGWLDANGYPLGSILSEGNLWIVIAVVVVVVGGVATLVIINKKKKPAAADGAEKEDE